MLSLLKARLRRLCSRLPWPRRRRRHSKLHIVAKPSCPTPKSLESSPVHSSRLLGSHWPPGEANREGLIRIVTFNAAFFSMAPAVGRSDRPTSFEFEQNHHQEPVRLHNFRKKSAIDRPKSILKNSPLYLSSVNSENGGATAKQQKFTKSKPRVSINLPDNEISLLRNWQLSFNEPGRQTAASTGRNSKGKLPMKYGVSFCGTGIDGVSNGYLCHHRGGVDGGGRTIAEVLREVDADIVALQDVKAEEERGMRPLSDLAKALGMNYVFAESWAPEYGNAILFRWPIRRWKVHKIFDHSDFR